MDDQRGKYLYDRKDADPEYDLLDQKAFVNNGGRRGGDAVVQIKPGDHARHKPEHERIISGGLRFEPELKDEPKYPYRCYWLGKGPDQPEV
jgi:hypothetical protein